jgi:hypothetical protein
MKILEKQYKYKIIGIPFCYSFQKNKVNKMILYKQVMRQLSEERFKFNDTSFFFLNHFIV